MTPPAHPVLYQPIRRLLARPVVGLLVAPRVSGVANVPATGPAILAGNHQSMLDPVVLGAAVPRTITFITRAEYFSGSGLRGRFVAGFFRSIGQLPVERSGGPAGEAHLAVARAVLEAGEIFGIYPEGSRSPDGLLHRGHTGVARLALATGAPVIPVATTGTNEVFAEPLWRPDRMRAVRPVVRIGPPVDLSPWRGRAVDGAALRAATDAVMAVLEAMTGLATSPTDARTTRAELAARRAGRDTGNGPGGGATAGSSH